MGNVVGEGNPISTRSVAEKLPIKLNTSVWSSHTARRGCDKIGLPALRVLKRTGGLEDTWGANSIIIHRRSAMVEVGDRVVVESEKVGTVTRSGVVTAVEDRLITVRWDSGSESVFVPSSGSLRVTGHEPPEGEAGNS